jgi:hypothetical protein
VFASDFGFRKIWRTVEHAISLSVVSLDEFLLPDYRLRADQMRYHEFSVNA